MQAKTQVHAEEGKQEVLITRTFELPLELLFKAYIEPEIVAQWMGTQVIKLENKAHGSWQFETRDPMGNKHGFHGTIHEFIPNSSIIRTFEMSNSAFPVQLEFLRFEALSEKQSRLEMQIVYKSVADRDRMLQLPFAQGINMAHNRLQDMVAKLS